MGNTNGFIKLHRKLREWGWYSDSVVKDVFIHLLMLAAWKDGSYKGYEVKAGQAVVGRKQMADDLGFSEQKIKTALKKLESTGEITRFSTNKFTIVTIENWEFYQCEDDNSNQQVTNNQPASNQQVTNNQPHLKKVKKVKKEKNIYNIPPTIDEVRAYCQQRENTVNPEQFIDYYESKGWLIGKSKMKDWKAAIRTWERRNRDKQDSESSTKGNTTDRFSSQKFGEYL